MSEDKNKKDYSNGKIYCIRNTITDDIYIGSTCQSLSKRMATRRKDSVRLKKQSFKIYKLMTEYGRDKFYIELIEDYPCENTYQLRRKEGELIRDIKPSLNKNVAGRTAKEYREQNVEKQKEYYEQNVDKLKQQKKEHYEQNVEEIKQKRKEYYEQNAEKIKQQKKEYRELNAEKIKQKSREYRQLNVERLKQKSKEYYYRKKAEKTISNSLD